jgi:hypothetical protein
MRRASSLVGRKGERRGEVGGGIVEAGIVVVRGGMSRSEGASVCGLRRADMVVEVRERR